MRARDRRRDFAARLLRRSLAEFAEDQCSQHAASIAYHVLFSLFPLAIVLAGASSLVLHATGSRAHVIDTIVRNLPLSASGARDIRGLLLGATSSTAGLGLIAIVGLIYSASGMMTALRTALNQAWDVNQPRPFLKGKLIDLGLVFAVATLGLGSLALTIAARLLSAHTALPSGASWAASALVPLMLAFGASLFLYRIIPAADVRVRDAWPAALIVAVLRCAQVQGGEHGGDIARVADLLAVGRVDHIPADDPGMRCRTAAPNRRHDSPVAAPSRELHAEIGAIGVHDMAVLDDCPPMSVTASWNRKPDPRTGP